MQECVISILYSGNFGTLTFGYGHGLGVVPICVATSKSIKLCMLLQAVALKTLLLMKFSHSLGDYMVKHNSLEKSKHIVITSGFGEPSMASVENA